MNNTFCKNCHRIPIQCVCQPTKPVAYVNSMCSDYIDWKVDPTSIDGQSLYTTPQTKPLSDEEILNLYKETGADNGGIREFVRAIEERHGIK